jgi:hypothetical protein
MVVNSKKADTDRKPFKVLTKVNQEAKPTNTSLHSMVESRNKPVYRCVNLLDFESTIESSEKLYKGSMI